MTDQESGSHRIKFPFGFHAPVRVKKRFGGILEGVGISAGEPEAPPKKAPDAPGWQVDPGVEKLLD